MTKKSPKMSKDDRRKTRKIPRAARLTFGKGDPDKRYARRDLRFLSKNSNAYWQEVLRREGLRLGRGKPNTESLVYLPDISNF